MQVRVPSPKYSGTKIDYRSNGLAIGFAMGALAPKMFCTQTFEEILDNMQLSYENSIVIFFQEKIYSLLNGTLLCDTTIFLRKFQTFFVNTLKVAHNRHKFFSVLPTGPKPKSQIFFIEISHSVSSLLGFGSGRSVCNC